MEKLSKKNLSLTSRTPVQVGTVIRAVNLYESLVITSEQLKHLSDSLLTVIKFYEESAARINKVFEGVIEGQLQIARTLQRVADALSVFDQINLIITKPNTKESAQIFVQPNRPYEKLKALPQPQRKQVFQLAAVSVQGQAFTINGEYIQGMTVNSKAGILFQLIIRQDLGGVISDKLLSKNLNVDVDDYRAWGIVFRDLKDVLKGNKLALNTHRYKATKQQIVRSLTKYIRMPRKTRQAVRVGKNN